MSTNFLFFNFVIQLFLTRVPSRKSKQKKKKNENLGWADNHHIETKLAGSSFPRKGFN